jgi:hypothetical protein
MARQLHLLPHDNLANQGDAPRDWRLDETTRTLGLQGLAQARAALRAARSLPRPPVRPTPTTRSSRSTGATTRRSAA